MRNPAENVPVITRASRLSVRASAYAAGTARPNVSAMATSETSTELSRARPRSAVCQAVPKFSHNQFAGSANGRVKISMLDFRALTAR
jgi:hypothetical protein